MKTVDVPGGQVTLREKQDITVRHRRMIEAATVAATSALAQLPASQKELEELNISDLKLTAADTTVLFELQDATIVASLESWTFPEPLPTLATIGDLHQDRYDALAQATRSLGSEIATGAVDFEPSDPHAAGFEATPTSPSDGSAAGLRADQEPQSISTQPDTGSSTVSAGPSLA